MDVAAVLPDFAEAFPFDEFNRMQEAALPALLETDENVVASAPTASGKTALAELAICRTLDRGGRAVFVAPMRALTTEKEGEWDRFESLGYSVAVVTGERDFEADRVRRADILVMTPEKLDSATRKADSRRYDFVTDIDLCVIDEVHLLDSRHRGAALEVTVARLRSLCAPRVIALSATLPNVNDVADWLDAPESCTFSFGQEYRPVDLHAEVTTYSPGENAFADKYRRLYRGLDLVEPHIDEDGQAIVFVASRRDAVKAAEKASEELADRGVERGLRGEYETHQRTDEFENRTLREAVLDGVAFHHAGLSRSDRELVEALFREGSVAVLFSTTTLAWGVNLPARCVVIRDTKRHDPLEGEVDVSPLDVLQMLGRAGRPDYDDVGYGWVLCPNEERDKYERLLAEGTPIESRLDEHLREHLNAEVAMGTVATVEGAMDWLEGTYYYARGQSRPADYGFSDLEHQLRDDLEWLADAGFLTIERDGSLSATRQGVLTSRYYLELETARRFVTCAESTGLGQEGLLRAVAGAAEFSEVAARKSERGAIASVLGDRTVEDLSAGQRKVLAVLLGSIEGDLPPALGSDAWVIRRNATRLLSALRAFLDAFASRHAANRAHRLEAAIEHGVTPCTAGLTAIDGIGSGRASKLAAEGIESPAALRERSVEELEAVGLARGVAERVRTGAAELPAIELEWEPVPETIAPGENELVTVTVRNTGSPAPVGIRVTVNGTTMTERETFLRDETTVPVGVFGADESPLEYTVSVAVGDSPLPPVRESHTVVVAA